MSRDKVMTLDHRLREQARLVAQWHGAIGSGPIEVLDDELGELGRLAAAPGLDTAALAEAIRPLFDGPEPVSLDRLGWWDGERGELLALTRVEIAKRIYAHLMATSDMPLGLGA
jgi:hypothetical protein